MTTTPSTKKLSFLSIFLLGINGIIGSGIFLLPGQTYAHLGLASVLPTILAGVAVLLVALNYAVMSSKIAGDGGAWLYADYAFGRFAGFQVGWFGWLFGVITLSCEVCALLTILKMIIPALSNGVIYAVVAVSLLLLLGIVNLFGTSFMGKLDNISTIAKLSVMALFIVVGVFFMHSINFALNLPHAATSTSGFLTNFTIVFGLIFYCYTGFNLIPIAGREMNNPQKSIPRVLIGVIITVTLIYAILQLVTIGLLGAKLSGNSVPVVAAFETIVGPLGKYIMIVGMSISVFGVAVANAYNSPIEAASLADEKGLLPKFMAKKNRFGAPFIANIATTLVAVILVLSGGYLFLVSLIVLTSFIQYLATVLAVIKVRHDPKVPGMKLPGGLLIPGLAMLITLYLVFSFDIKVAISGLIFFVIGCLIFTLADTNDLAKIKKEL